MHPQAQRTRQFIEQASLPPLASLPSLTRERGAATAAAPSVALALEQGKQQAAVVGSDVVSFATGVAPQWRSDVMQCTLFAQLFANARVPDRSRIFDWYDAYFRALEQLGWAVQDKGFAVYVESSANFSAHQAILKVAEALLMPAVGSWTLVKTTLEALQGMGQDSPFITLFNRESQQASAARFQVSLAEQSADGGLTVALMAFGLEAQATLTQVLFFRSLASQATLRHCSGKMAVDTNLLQATRAALAAKLQAHAASFIQQLPDF